MASSRAEDNLAHCPPSQIVLSHGLQFDHPRMQLPLAGLCAFAKNRKLSNCCIKEPDSRLLGVDSAAQRSQELSMICLLHF